MLANGLQVLGNDNGPPVLGNGPHLLGITRMSHAALCRSAYPKILYALKIM